MNAFAQCRQVCWLAVGYTHSRVATTNAAHGAIAVHLVQRCIRAGSNCPVACCRVGHHWANDDVAGFGQDLAENHIRLLPQNVAVKRPDVGKAKHVGFLG